MKKIIVYISVIITIFGILVTASPYLLKMFGLDEPFKRFLIPKIIDDSQGYVDIHNFKIGLGKLELTDVAVASKDEQFTLLINSIEFDFKFLDLLLNPTKPQKAIDAIYLVKPRLILKKVVNESSVDFQNDYLETDQFSHLFENLNQIQSIKRIQISEGRIIYRKKSGQYISIAQNLNGWLNTKDFSNIQLNGEGNLFSAPKENFKLTSNINLLKKQFNVIVELIDYKVSNSILPHFTNEIIADSGELTGSIVFKNRGFDIDSTKVNGNLFVDNLNMLIDNNEFNQIGFQIDINNNQLVLKNGVGDFFKKPFKFEAAIDNILEPEVCGQLIINDLSLKQVEKYLPTDLLNDSNLDLVLDVRLKDNQPQIQAKINSDVLYVYEQEKISNFKANLIWSPEELVISHASGVFRGVKLKGFGNYNPDKNNFKIHFDGHHKFGEHVIFDQLSNKIQRLTLDIFYNTKKKSTLGNWLYSICNESDTLLFMYGDIKGRGNAISINLLDSNAGELQASIKVDNYLKAPLITDARLINFPIINFTSEPLLQKPLDRFLTDISLKGTLNNLTGSITVIDKQNFNNDFRLNTSFLNLLSSKRQIKGSIGLKRLYGFYEFNLTDDFLGGTFNFPQGIEGELSLDLAKEEQIFGLINFTDFNIVQVFSDSSFRDDFRLLGNINGQVDINGNFRDPKIQANLSGDKFVFNDVGYYQAELHLEADKSRIKVDSLEININNIPILSGELSWSFIDNQINGSLSGEKIDVEQILTTVSQKPPFLSGMGSYLMGISGCINSPEFSVSVEIKNGILDEIAFDDFKVIMWDNISEDGKVYDYKDHNVTLENFYLAKKGRFHLSGEGILPLNSSDEIDINVKFDGDILNLIPHWQPFFVDGTSLAAMNFKLGGTRDYLRLKSGVFEIERGELWLRQVAQHIENIHGKIELKSGTNQINFIDFKASVDDETLTINTVRNIETSDGKQLENWYFKGVDLDFGILKLETSGEGMELNLPGLMEKEDVGQLYLSGRTADEHFYFAGPVKHPVVRGTVTLFNARLTYPFLTSQKPGKKPSVAVQFLKNMNWDILVKSGEDVLYVREIPAYIDNVHTELFADESSPGLELVGIINEGTFKPVGLLTSSRGRLEYLDQNFKVDRFAMEFTEFETLPVISGRAWTSIRDSVGAIPKTIYLELYAIDQETGLEKQQGGWEDFKFRLVSADPQIGETQEQVLAYLGFSVGNIREKATSVGGAVTEKYLIRPLLRPIERVLERSLGMDMVRINSNIARNLFYSSLGSQSGFDKNGYSVNPFTTNAPYLFLMQSSEVTVGKYLSQNLYLTYTGQLVSVYDKTETGFDFNHSFGIEYRFFWNVLLELEYDRQLMGYYKIPNQKQYLEDFKIRLRHSFSF